MFTQHVEINTLLCYYLVRGRVCTPFHYMSGLQMITFNTDLLVEKAVGCIISFA